jgi:internalin A
MSKNSEIFISYAWGGESEEIVNKIYPILVEKGFNVIRDKVDLGYKGNIKEFMQRIGMGKAIVVVISDKYLKSENCMFEILEIHRNKDTWNRIFPIVLRDARMYDEIERIDYLVYWDTKIADLNAKIKTLQNAAGIGAVIEKVNQYTDIRRFNDEIMSMLRDMNTLTPDMHCDNNFESLIKALMHIVDIDINTSGKNQSNQQKSMPDGTDPIDRKYKLPNIQKLLISAFDDTTFNQFCMFYFDEVYNTFCRWAE